MGDIKLSISIKEENNILFKRCVRKLLDSTFIVGDKDEKLYSFISRESNRQDIINGYTGFLFLDKNGMPKVSQHWQKCFQLILQKYNNTYRMQLPKITPHGRVIIRTS